MPGPRTIVAMGGGGFQMEPEDRLLDDHVLALARDRSGRDTPRVCLIPTATADDPTLVESFRDLFAPPRAEPGLLSLFERTDEDLADLVLRHDAVYVTGGNSANLLALSSMHGLDRVLRRAWNARGRAGRDVSRRDLLVRVVRHGLVRTRPPPAPRRARDPRRVRLPRTTTARPSGGRSASG